MITEMTPYIEKMAAISDSRNEINADMHSKYKVFWGLRNLNGKGVVTVLTEVSNIKAKEIDSFGNEILDVKNNSGQPNKVDRYCYFCISISNFPSEFTLSRKVLT